MALSKSMLTGMGLTEEQIKAILEGHKESLDHYQGEADTAKAEAEEAKKQLDKVQKELNAIKEESESDANPYKAKYEAIKEEFAAYKSEITAKETKATKKEAFKALLKECGVSEKRIDTVLKCEDERINGLELEDGKIKDVDTLKAAVKQDWSDFITSEGTQGASTATPPANNGGGKKTKEEIMAIKDTTERQQAMYDNKELFL